MTIEISIIIPTYNEEKYIKKAIKSLLNSDKNKDLIEIIIVDGLSTDKTLKRVKELMPKYKNINILINNI